jgi:hypothetical protein
MQFRIHFTLSDGKEDSVIVSGSTIEAIREAAIDAVERRQGKDPWSEEIIDHVY